ncbi:hypothetical protein TNCV_2754301 [Trichonephila clavipes]|nr:hypothetical protein TNCV_2754301 [Trichonephila clavipes]
MSETEKQCNSPSVTYTSSSVLETYNTVVVTNSGFPTVLSSSQNHAMPCLFSSGLHEKKKEISTAADSVRSEDLIRVVEDLDGTVESTDTIVKLKTKIENSSTFESDPDFVKTLIQNCIDERVSRNEREVTLEKQKIELAKLQLAKLEKEIELQTAKNKALRHPTRFEDQFFQN